MSGHATYGNLRHGDARKGAHAPEHTAWSRMIARCTNPNRVEFKDYGGRGIAVAPEWLGRGGYERFLEHIGRRPTPLHTVDRIDNERGYEPGNVRWATRAEQSANRRYCRPIAHAGRTQTIAAWARELGMDEGVIRGRLDRGASAADALAPVTFEPGVRGWKLTAEDVARMRSLVAGGLSQRAAAREFSVCGKTVARIVAGKIWRSTEAP